MTLTLQSVSTEILQLILPWPFPSRLIYTLGGRQYFLSFLPWKHSNYLPLFSRFSTHFHQFSTQKYAISAMKQNKVLPSFYQHGHPRKQNMWYFATQKPEVNAQGWKKSSGWWNSCFIFHLGIGNRTDLESVSIKQIKHLHLTPLSHKAWNICCSSKSTRLQKWCCAFHT